MLKRSVFNEIWKDLSSPAFTIITGARQVGKTTLLKQLLKKLKEHSQNVFYLTLEDPEYLEELNKHPKNIFHIFPVQDSGRTVILVDEIQYLNNPSNFLKYLYDEYNEKIKLVVTGSSAFYLDKKFRDSLAGRKKIFEMNTLTLEEFFRFKGREELSEYIKDKSVDNFFELKIPLSLKRDFNRYVNEYLVYGGYPRVVLADDPDEKKEILGDLRSSYIKRDILESGIRDDLKVMGLLKILASQIGSLLNINSLAETLRVSHSAIESYLVTLKKSFIVYTVPPFSGTVSGEIRKMPKIYFADLGLRNMFLKNFNEPRLRTDRGELYENFIFRQISDLVEIDDIYFWRTRQGNEVDFIVEDRFAFEVKYNCSSVKPSKYKLFKKRYEEIPLHFICREGDSQKQQPEFFHIF